MDKKAKMYSLVEEWRVSGMTRKKFASLHSLSEVTFGYWCKKFERQRESPDPVPVVMPAFVELSLEEGTAVIPRTLQAELEFASGLRLKIYA
jgi:hypothetical protein